LTSSKGDITGRVALSSETSRKLQVRRLEERTGCPFNLLKVAKCDWDGSQSDLVGHCIEDHGAEVQEKSAPFVVKLQNVSKSRSFHKGIVIWGRLFYLLWVKNEGTMHFLVYVIPKHTDKYTYDFKLKKGQEEISITGGICSSLLQPPYEGREKGDTIKLTDHKVQKYLDTKDNLSCIIEIKRQEGTPSSGEADKARVPDASK
jgi:hypothetical protein